MKDFLGQTFEVGQTIAYGGRAGTRGFMAVGKIEVIRAGSLSVRVIKHSDGIFNEFSKLSVVQRPDRAVIVSGVA